MQSAGPACLPVPSVLPVPPAFQIVSRRTRELFFRHRADDRPGTKTCKTTILEADRVLASAPQPVRWLDGASRLILHGITHQPRLPCMGGRSVIVGAARACET